MILENGHVGNRVIRGEGEGRGGGGRWAQTQHNKINEIAPYRQTLNKMVLTSCSCSGISKGLEREPRGKDCWVFTIGTEYPLQ